MLIMDNDVYKDICIAIYFHSYLWYLEFKQVFKTVKTPQQEYDSIKNKSTFVGYDLFGDGKSYSPASMIKQVRERSYALFENNFFIAFFLMSISSLDQRIQRIIERTGYEMNKFDIGKFCNYIQNKLHNNINKETIFYEQYDSYRTLYNFLKHNNGSYYQKLKKTPLSVYLIDTEFMEDSLSYEYCKLNCQFIESYLLFMEKFVDILVKNIFSKEEYKKLSSFNADKSNEYLLENEYINCCVWSDVIKQY